MQLQWALEIIKDNLNEDEEMKDYKFYELIINAGTKKWK